MGAKASIVIAELPFESSEQPELLFPMKFFNFFCTIFMSMCETSGNDRPGLLFLHTCPRLAEILLFCFYFCPISSQLVCDLCGFHPKFWPSPLLINEQIPSFLIISPLLFELTLPGSLPITNFRVLQKL